MLIDEYQMNFKVDRYQRLSNYKLRYTGHIHDVIEFVIYICRYENY